ncbi:heme peroxidase [Mycena albidolilacea]|uniref:Peroxidase n=1 Tax=Mycena albidolilacea TaxID=1033008 RepID=A0AAD6ZYC2_9AGAR|nr:heme peroxidase [Mycena albidolilacea]
MPQLTLFTITVLLTAAHAYIWPSPQLDALESLRFDTDRHQIAPFVQPCTFFIFEVAGKSGRSNAADWIRTAYHDMATHNNVDGTGGMDASIRFPEEQARVENVADGFNNTVRIVGPAANRYVSLADVLALAAITAIENCGGPSIPFRGGRIDAAAPNAPGVPQPQEDLATHTATFKRQGFSKTEIIGLVACGHTFGGVAHAPFPDIVPDLNDTSNTQSVAHFDGTPVAFDNSVASQYIANTTRNPLIVGTNATTNSDARIFGSDGGKVMRGFASSPALFASTCASLFARMLDTVPSGVVLSEVLSPLPAKPDALQLTLDGDKLLFAGEVRFWNTPDSSSRTVLLLGTDHSNHTFNATLVSAGTASSSSAGAGQTITNAWYSFDDPGVVLDAAAGVKRISFTVYENGEDAKKKTKGKVFDQGGRGFAVQDAVVFSKTSCLTKPNAQPVEGRLDVGVRTGAKVTRVFLEEEVKDSVGRITVVETDFPRPAPAAGNSTSKAYTIWSLPMTQSSAKHTVGAEIDGVKVSTGRVVVLTNLPACT